MERPVYLIVGLGNPGRRYEATYHNCGWMALDAVADAWGVRLDRSHQQALYGQVNRGGARVILMKPLTFMNNSGVAVRAFADYYKIPPEHIAVLYDDIDLAVGALRVRAKGSAGTHNGMRSIVQHLGSTAFPRFRIGIGPVPPHRDLIDYVLATLSEEAAAAMGAVFDRIEQGLSYWISDDIQLAMNRVNERREPKKPARPEPAAAAVDATAAVAVDGAAGEASRATSASNGSAPASSAGMPISEAE